MSGWLSGLLFSAATYVSLPLTPALYLFEILMGLWLLCVGGSVGSFMNVVVFRMPEGRSVVSPGSRCPKCGHDIRWYDNIPVLSWMNLRGRCRYCGTGISSRYFWVELLVAVMFLAVAIVEPFSYGENLPPLSRRYFLPTPLLWTMYALHVTLLSTLLAAALIERDAKRVPLRLYGPALLAVLVLPAIWPELRPLPLHVDWQPDAWWIGVVEGAAGGAAGLLLGLLAWPAMTRGRSARAGGWAVVTACVLAGAALGWQAVCAIATATSVTWLISAAAGRLRDRGQPLPWLALFTAATGLHIAAWRWIVSEVPMWGYRADWVTVGVAGVVVLGASAMGRLLVRPWSEPEHPGEVPEPAVGETEAAAMAVEQSQLVWQETVGGTLPASALSKLPNERGPLLAPPAESSPSGSTTEPHARTDLAIDGGSFADAESERSQRARDSGDFPKQDHANKEDDA